MWRCLFALAGLAAVAGWAVAVEADPNKEYPVTPEAGAYLICAASYTGPQAAQTAHELVLDIRRHFNLPAYVFNKGDKERREQQAERERLKKLCPEGRFRTVRIEDQCAVLVGGYKDIDSARRALDDIKKLKPTDKRLMHVLFAGVAGDGDAKNKPDAGATYVSPFMDSFVVPNPLTVNERKVEKKPDPFLKQLNANEEYSLLKCRAPWTLAVASYQGTSVIQSDAQSGSFLSKIFGQSSGEVLAASAMNAHNLAEAMRKMGLDAYVLHTRHSSVVTVGAFSRADDPRMREVQQALASKMQKAPNLQMLPEPMPMEVPRP
jgi:hypothetical protein